MLKFRVSKFLWHSTEGKTLQANISNQIYLFIYLFTILIIYITLNINYIIKKKL